MIEPKLTRSTVQVTYAADDGYKSECGFTGGKTCEPHAGLLGGLDEVARLLALFGHEQDARITFDAALRRIEDWRKAQAERTEGGGTP